jgi:hypothetical protein
LMRQYDVRAQYQLKEVGRFLACSKGVSRVAETMSEVKERSTWRVM